MSYVYAARRGDQLKIGETSNVSRRLQAFGRDIELLAAWKVPHRTDPGCSWRVTCSSRLAEIDLHARLHRWLIHGEWFQATPETLAFVAQWKASGLPTPPKATRTYAPASKSVRRWWLEIFYDTLASTGSKTKALNAAREWEAARHRRAELLQRVNAMRAANRRLRADLHGRRSVRAA